jgi:hypothetical protein
LSYVVTNMYAINETSKIQVRNGNKKGASK